MTDDQLLILYFDGELDLEECQEIEQRLKIEPELSQSLNELIQLRSVLSDEFVGFLSRW